MSEGASFRAAVEAARSGSALVRVAVVRAEGSTPREAGAAMLVGRASASGTIGGGALELEAVRHARELLDRLDRLNAWHRETRDFALGPSLGQCCGGGTGLLFEVWTPREAARFAQELDHRADSRLALRPLSPGMAPLLLASRKDVAADVPAPVLRLARDMLAGVRPLRAELLRPGKGLPAWFLEPVSRPLTPLFVYGAGHVGRAIVAVMQGLPFDVHWVDTTRDRFPDAPPAYARVIPVADPASFAAMSPAGAFHLILTFSHALDLAIVHALLRRADAAFVGLIGSDTKAARFRKRLRELGVSDAAIGRLTCPIGIGGLTGKEPAVIAIAVAAQLIALVEGGIARFEPVEARGG